AVAASPANVDDTEDLHAWVKAFSPRVKDQWLARAIDHLDLALGTELRRSFRSERQQRLAPGRSVAELRAAAEEIYEKRKKRAKKKRTDVPRPSPQPRSRSSR